MYNSSNPAELYPGTTWELLPNDKFLKTGATPLQQGGSNSVKITKANLPAEKLQVESHSMTRGTMNITGKFVASKLFDGEAVTSGALYNAGGSSNMAIHGENSGSRGIGFDASRSWAGSTSAASPYTTTMGSGTALTINPAHITLKAWKRLS